MDPGDAFSGNLFKWDPRSHHHHHHHLLPPPTTIAVTPSQQNRMVEAMAPPAAVPLQGSSYTVVRPMREVGGGQLEELFQPYGIRYYTAARIAELGFTVNTLLGMKDEELDEMMNSLCQIFRWDLMVGERYGIKAAIRAERRRLDDRRLHDHTNNTMDALSQEGLSEEHVQHEKEAVGSGGGGTWEVVTLGVGKKKQRRKKSSQSTQPRLMEEDEDDDGEGDSDQDMDENLNGGGNGGSERQREHPFIVTEPGEVARGKKNGLDYLFHLYEQCREFLLQVQNISKERGEKCPTKVTNQVFRYAKRAGASYINKPKMRHYVHCYALHCLDEDASNALRRAYKERGENVGAWRQACYKPLVAIAARQSWDIDFIFNTHHRLSIWYVPTKLRQLCHAERSCAAAATSVSVASNHHLPF